MKLIKKLLLIYLSLIAIGLHSNELRLNIGFWPGELDPELQPRFFLDDLVEGGGVGRINLDWANKTTYTIYPLGIQYLVPVKNNKLVFAANFIGFFPDYKFNGIYLSPLAVSIVELKKFGINDIEGEIGYQIQANQVVLTPKIGSRFHKQTFEYNELTIGEIIGFSFGDNLFDAHALGTYMGVDLAIKLQNNLSLVGEYLNTAFFPGFSGSMEFKTSTIALAGNFFALAITNQSSSYDVKIERLKLGLLYDVDKTKHIEFGIRTETQKHSYPGYFNVPIIITSTGGANLALDTVFEIITDYIFWRQEQDQKKGLLYFAFRYDIPM
ncbi:MAG: hypothetical protein ACK4UJ_08765 [Leptonema sp. (in: bacteria)]